MSECRDIHSYSVTTGEDITLEKRVIISLNAQLDSGPFVDDWVSQPTLPRYGKGGQVLAFGCAHPLILRSRFQVHSESVPICYT